jgi:hypothetical protein
MHESFIGLGARIAAIPGDALAGFVPALAATASAATAAMTAVTGHVHATGGRGTGVLIAGHQGARPITQLPAPRYQGDRQWRLDVAGAAITGCSGT